MRAHTHMHIHIDVPKHMGTNSHTERDIQTFMHIYIYTCV